MCGITFNKICDFPFIKISWDNQRPTFMESNFCSFFWLDSKLSPRNLDSRIVSWQGFSWHLKNPCELSSFTFSLSSQRFVGWAQLLSRCARERETRKAQETIMRLKGEGKDPTVSRAKLERQSLPSFSRSGDRRLVSFACLSREVEGNGLFPGRRLPTSFQSQGWMWEPV